MVISFQNALALFNSPVLFKWSFGVWTVDQVGSRWGGEKCSWTSWKCSKEQRLELGTLQAKGWTLIRATYPHASHMALECVSISRAIWRNRESDEGVDLSTLDGWATIHLQVKRSENVLMTEFLEVSSWYTNSRHVTVAVPAHYSGKTTMLETSLIERQLRKWILHFFKI